MNTLESFFQWLLAASLRASLLAGAVVCLQLALQRWLPARWRFALWLPVVLVLIAPVLPESRFSVQNRLVEKTAPAIVRMEPLPAMGISALETVPAELPIVLESRWTPRQRMLAVWLCGTATVFMVGLLGYRHSMRCILRDAVKIDAKLADTISSVAAELRLRRAPRTIVSISVGSPAVAGLLRPMLLLPADFPADFSPSESRLVLMHELTHLKRRDLPMNWLMCILQAMHWFNPLLWLAFARMRADRETACDAQVLASSSDDCRAEYGNALLKLQTAPRHTGLSLAFVGIFQRNAALRSRIQSIAAHRPAHPAWSLAALAIMVALTMVGATRAETKAVTEPAGETEKRQVIIESRFIEIPEKEALVISAQAVERRVADRAAFAMNGKDLDAMMDLLFRTKRADLLSSPRVIAAEKQKATIQVGREVSVPDKVTGKPGLENVGVQLTVVPTVGKDGISLAVTSIQTRLIDSETKKEIKGEPKPGTRVEISELKIESTIMLKSGETGILMRAPEKGAPSVITTISAKVGSVLEGPGRNRDQLKGLPESSKPSPNATPKAEPFTAGGLVYLGNDGPSITCYVSPTLRSMLAEGKPVEVKFEELENTKFAGKVTVIDPKSDPGSGLVRLKIALNGTDNRVKAGMKCVVNFRDSVPSTSSEFKVTANEVTRDEKAGLVRATGNVKIRIGDRVVETDAATIRDAMTLPAAENEAKKDFVLPVIDLKDASVRHAADVIMEYSKAVDPDKKGVKIVVFPNVGAGTKITLSLKDIPVTEAMKFIASLSNAKLMHLGSGIYLGNPEIAKPVAGKPGFVFSPYKPDGEIDVRGIPQNTKAECPYTGMPFLIP